jgi:hypothetical protein
MLMAIRWEERDLIVVHGANYENYRNQVPALVPSLVPYRGVEEPGLQSQRPAA